MSASSPANAHPLTASTLLWIVASLLLLAVLALGLFMPLQTDEIAWGYANGRAIADHATVITLLPQCQAADTFAKPLPLAWYPHALVNHLLFMQPDGLLPIRIIGMIRFLMFLVASWFIAKPLAGCVNCSPEFLYILFLSMLCQDALPLLMQINRPEQPILLAIAIFLALALNAPVIARHVWARRIAPALFILTALLAFPVHPKAVALLPIALASAFLLFKELTKRKWVIALILVTLTGFAVESVTFWLERYICTRSPETQEIIAAHSLPWNLIWTAPGLFVQMATKDFLSSVISDFTVSHHIKQTHAWLPQSLTVLPIWMLLVNSLCAAVNFLTNIAIFYFCLVFFLNTVVLRPRKILSGFFATPLSDNLEEGGEPRIITISYLLGSACFASLIGTILLTGSIHTFYLVSLQAPLLFLTALFCMAARAVDLSWASQWRIHCFWLQILAIISIFLIIFRYYPYITTPESRESFTPNRAIMLSPWRYKNQKNAIEEAYADCHLPPTGAARHLVLDDFTYPVLKHSYQPFSFHYITDLFDSNHFSAPKLLEDMKYYNSQGIILNCKSVPPALAPYLTDHGGYCCAAGKDLPK